jgi:hypothetical protein
MKPAIERLQKTLTSAAESARAHDAITALAKAAKKGDEEAKAALVAYVLDGRFDHVRSYACSWLAEIVGPEDEKFAQVFERGLSDEASRFWSVVCCVNALGRGAYEAVTKVALDESVSVEDRAHAVMQLASHSGQPFAQGLPDDPGEWQADDLRVDELRAWAKGGFSEGKRSAPARHPALDDPKSALEKAASRLDKRLAKRAGGASNLRRPAAFLAPAAADDLERIAAFWTLPAIYLDFLTRFSPVDAVLETKRFWNGGLRLFGAGELIEAQRGYAVDPTTGKRIRGWPKEHLVIATHGGDPFVHDLSSSDGEDAPVLTAEHGAGRWTFRPAASSFQEFLTSLGKS